MVKKVVVNRNRALFFSSFFFFISFMVFPKENSISKLLAEAYKDYHFWRLDKALLKINEALDLIDRYYRISPNYKIKDKNLKIKEAYRVKSTAHIIKGLIYYRKAIQTDGLAKKEESRILRKAIESNKSLQKLPPDELYKRLKGKIALIDKKYSSLSKKYMKLSYKEFKLAVKLDPDNPDAHFHYGSKVLFSTGDMKGGERELYKAALLFNKEGDKNRVKEVLNYLERVSPNSRYIEKIMEFLN